MRAGKMGKGEHDEALFVIARPRYVCDRYDIACEQVRYDHASRGINSAVRDLLAHHKLGINS